MCLDVSRAGLRWTTGPNPSRATTPEDRPMSDHERKSDEAVRAHVVYALSLMNEGHCPEVVQAKLVERGLTEDEAGGVVCDLLMQAIYAEAVDMLNRGQSPEQVKRQLAAKGLEQQTASAVVEDVL